MDKELRQVKESFEELRFRRFNDDRDRAWNDHRTCLAGRDCFVPAGRSLHQHDVLRRRTDGVLLDLVGYRQHEDARKSRKSHGRDNPTVTFLVTAAIAAIVMYVVVRFINIVPAGFSVDKMVTSTEDIADITPGQLIVNFFTKPDFGELLSRRAMLPLIVAAILFGFGIQLSGGPETRTAAMLEDLTACIMKTVKIITFYAPVGFFGFFANLAATYGPELMGGYAKTLVVYYIMCFVYMFLFFPIYARFGGGKGGAGVMWRHLFKPAAVAFGTCSSVATIPTNMEAAQETGISKDVSEIVLPLGATMHMDGSAMSAIVKVAFLFGISGMDFGTGRAVIAIIVAIFASVAMSGIPGGGGVGELVLCSIFFNNSPEQLTVAYTLALAIGNLVDPPATMVNAAGDYVVSFIVSKYVDGKDWLQKQLSK